MSLDAVLEQSWWGTPLSSVSFSSATALISCTGSKRALGSKTSSLPEQCLCTCEPALLTSQWAARDNVALLFLNTSTHGMARHGTARSKVIPLEVSAVVQLAAAGSAPIFMSRKSTSTPPSPSAGCRGHECRDSSILSSLLRMGANKRLTVHVGISPFALLCHTLRSEHHLGSQPALA